MAGDKRDAPDPDAPTVVGGKIVPPDAFVPGAHAGRTLGPYRIDSVVGHGGMGVVYRAEHEALGRAVALKLLTPELSRDASFRERFVREARAAAAVTHPNIVTVYDAGEIEGSLYIAMQYVDGRDLHAIVAERGTLPIAETRRIVAEVASGLDAAHAAGLVHRDVKAANVLVDAERSYLTDFGLAKSRALAQRMTKPGDVVGTLEYLAPEQIRGGPVDRRTDVYGLGCLLYVLLTGRDPFPGEDVAQRLYAHLDAPAPRASADRPELPEAVDDVIAHALAKTPTERFERCSDLASAFGDAISGATDEQAQPRARVLILADEPARARRLRVSFQVADAELVEGRTGIAAAPVDVAVVSAGSADSALTLVRAAALEPPTKVLAIVPRAAASEPVAGADIVLGGPVSDVQLMVAVQSLLGRPIVG